MGALITKIKEIYNEILNPNCSLSDKEWLELKKQFTHTKDADGIIWRDTPMIR